MEKEKTKNLNEIENDEAADVFDNPEPWSSFETKLVVWSFISAFIALVIFGLLVNKYILHAF